MTGRAAVGATLALALLASPADAQVVRLRSSASLPTDNSGQANFCGPDATTNVEIGSCANDANAGTGGTSVVIGNSANNAGNGTGVVVIGSGASATTGNDGIAIGRGATAGNLTSIAIGATSSAITSASVALGFGANASASQAIAIGSASVAAVNEFVAGSASGVMSNVYFGRGKTSTTASAITINGTGGSGSDNAGADLILAGGKSTGAAVPANVLFQTSTAAGSSSTLQTLSTRLTLSSTSLTSTLPFLVADGTANAPSVALSSDSDGTGTGLYRGAANLLSFAANGAEVFRVGTGVPGAIALTSLGIGSTDTSLQREAAAILQFGGDVNGAAVPYVVKGHDGVTGTDIAGANITIAGGRGTGAGSAGDFIIQTAPALATGTTAQTLGDRFRMVAKAKTLTESAATSFVQIGIASGGFTGGTVEYTVVASDGTDHQSRKGTIFFAGVNKAGTETCPTPTEVGTSLAALSAGTLTVTWTADTTPTNACNLQANAVSSLTQTTLALYYTVNMDGPGTITPQ